MKHYLPVLLFLLSCGGGQSSDPQPETQQEPTPVPAQPEPPEAPLPVPTPEPEYPGDEDEGDDGEGDDDDDDDKKDECKYLVPAIQVAPRFAILKDECKCGWAIHFDRFSILKDGKDDGCD